MEILDRRALGRPYLSALEFPRREAEMVQMVATDLRTRVRRRACSKFKLVAHLAAPHRIATHRTCRACAVALERAARFGYWRGRRCPLDLSDRVAFDRDGRLLRQPVVRRAQVDGSRQRIYRVRARRGRSGAERVDASRAGYSFSLMDTPAPASANFTPWVVAVSAISTPFWFLSAATPAPPPTAAPAPAAV